MAANLMQLYDAMTESAQEELYNFALFLTTNAKNIRSDRKKNVGSDFFGALQEYANPNLIDQEKDAWAEAVAEKYRSQNDN